jgi:hypothetical protein
LASAAFASAAAGASAAFSTLAVAVFVASVALLRDGKAKTIDAEIIVASRIFFIIQSSWKKKFFVLLSKIVHLV